MSFAFTVREISIHTLRVEGDLVAYHRRLIPRISIHTLRVEGDWMRGRNYRRRQQSFQSTPSAWRVTPLAVQGRPMRHISIHTLRVEGDTLERASAVTAKISIHTLRVEGDRTQRTPWRAAGNISIHTLRVEGDWALLACRSWNPSISIHTLRVEGDSSKARRTPSAPPFQSTPSAWRVTATPWTPQTPPLHFNPHPPRGG